MDQITAELRKIPVVTRVLTLSTAAVTLPVILELLSPYKIVFVPRMVTHDMQVRARLEVSHVVKWVRAGVAAVYHILLRGCVCHLRVIATLTLS